MAWLLVGSIPGVLIGSQMTVKLPERLLRVGLATMLTLSGVKLLDAPTIVPADRPRRGAVALLATVALGRRRASCQNAPRKALHRRRFRFRLDVGTEFPGYR